MIAEYEPKNVKKKLSKCFENVSMIRLNKRFKNVKIKLYVM